MLNIGSTNDIIIPAGEVCFLSQNHPNPFSGETLIQYQIPEYGFVQIEVYSLLGRKVRILVNDCKESGVHEVIWNARDDHGKELEEGMYIYTLKTRDNVIFRKAVLHK